MKHMDAKESFLKVYDEHADAIYRFCMARTGNTELSHDLTQDTFMRFWDTLLKKGSIQYPRALIYQIARNAIIDWYRKHKSESLDTMQETGFEPEDTLLGDANRRTEHAHVVSIMHKLPQEQREIIMLRYVEGLPPREIAEIIGESTNNTSVRINRAMESLRQVLQTNEYE